MLLPILYNQKNTFLLYEIMSPMINFRAIVFMYSNQLNAKPEILLHEEVDQKYVDLLTSELENNPLIKKPLLCFADDDSLNSEFLMRRYQVKKIIEQRFMSNEIHRIQLLTHLREQSFMKDMLGQIAKIYLADGHHRWYALSRLSETKQVYYPIMLTVESFLNMQPNNQNEVTTIAEVKALANKKGRLRLHSTIFTPKPMPELAYFNVAMREILPASAASEKLSEIQLAS